MIFTRRIALVVVPLSMLLVLVSVLGMPGISFLKPDEQLVIYSPSTISVVNGPCVATFTPGVSRGVKRKALQLSETEYATIKNTLTGNDTVVKGPTLHFLGPYDKHTKTYKKIVLTDKQYVRLLDTKSGKQRLVKGPATVVPEPLESYEDGVLDAVKLEEMDYTVVTNTLNGAQRVVQGPTLLFPGLFETILPTQSEDHHHHHHHHHYEEEEEEEEEDEPHHHHHHHRHHQESRLVHKKVALKKNEYAKVVDEGTGNIRVVRGPQVLVPAKATERLGPVMPAYELQRHQYVKLVDQATGKVRVERGEDIIFPGPNEEAVPRANSVRDAVRVDDETAVLVNSKQTGQQRLVVEKGLFFPDRYDEIVEVRKLVRVAPHEVAIARDNEGAFHFYSGSGEGADAKGGGTAFFLQPHHELVTMMWSSGSSADDVKNSVVKKVTTVAYKVPVEKIDLRPQYAFFEYTVRTSDNVELVLEGQIFWQVSDVPRMIERTGDPKGDVWYHARSALIQAVSLVTLETFMASFNAIVQQAAATDKAFYEARGVVLHNLEVVRFEPKDEKTRGVLQQIIQETTNHINRMQVQRSETEVEKEKMDSMIAIEKQRAGLIEQKTANDKALQAADGEAEGQRLAQSTLVFMEQLNKTIGSEEARVALLRFFAEQKTAVEHSRRYASNPKLTTVIEGSGATDVKPVPELKVGME